MNEDLIKKITDGFKGHPHKNEIAVPVSVAGQSGCTQEQLIQVATGKGWGARVDDVAGDLCVIVSRK